MVPIDDKALILQSTDYCKKRNALITQIKNLKTLEHNLYPLANPAYQTSLYLKAHHITLFHFLYWCAAFILYYYITRDKLVLLLTNLSQHGIDDYSQLFDACRQNFSLIIKLALPFLLLLLLYATILIIRRILIKKKCRKLATEQLHTLQSVSHDITAIQQQLNALETIMSDPHNCIIPPAYWSAGQKIEEYILNIRAHNITEAINLYEAEKNTRLSQTQLAHCPRCGCTNISTQQTVINNGNSNIVIGILIFLFLPIIGWIVGIIILCSSSSQSRIITTNICQNCGYHY